MLQLKFTLRSDMPRGFKQNTQYPELPALRNYLTLFDNQSFSDLKTFGEDVLAGWKKYLEANKILIGGDPKLREGLRVEELDERMQTEAGDVWDYELSIPANNGPGKCVFGGLEKIS